MPIPDAGAIVRHMQTDSTRGRVWLALSGTGRLGKIEVGGGTVGKTVEQR